MRSSKESWYIRNLAGLSHGFSKFLESIQTQNTIYQSDTMSLMRQTQLTTDNCSSPCFTWRKKKNSWSDQQHKEELCTDIVLLAISPTNIDDTVINPSASPQFARLEDLNDATDVCNNKMATNVSLSTSQSWNNQTKGEPCARSRDTQVISTQAPHITVGSSGYHLRSKKSHFSLALT
jgi:hypothetical protein